jgi:WD40 repeat protein
VEGVSFVADFMTLTSVSVDGTLRTWDALTGACRERYEIDTDLHWTRTQFSREGQLAAWKGAANTLVVWNVAQRRALVLDLLDDLPYSCAFSSDGQILAVGCKRAVQFWDLKTERVTSSLKHSFELTRSLAYSRDGRFLAIGGSNGIVTVWNLPAKKTWNLTHGDSDALIFSLVFTADGTVLASADGDVLCLWDVQTGREMYRIADGSHTVCMSPKGSLLASGGGDGIVRVRNVKTCEMSQEFSKHNGEVTCLAFSSDEKYLASGSRDATVLIWQLQ